MTRGRLSLVVGGASVLSLAIGSALGYKFAQKKLELEYRELAEREIAEAKRFYSVLYKKDQFNTPKSAAESLLPVEAEAVEALRSYQGKEVTTVGTEGEFVPQRSKPFGEAFEDEPTGEVEPVARNVFQPPRPSEYPDYETEVRNRTEEAPYVVTHEEFFLNEPEHEQVTVTYYAGDQVLADERDQPIDNKDMAVGDDNLVKFGQWSNDPRVVYVRNEHLSTDFEVLLSDGKFVEEVLGMTPRSG